MRIARACRLICLVAVPCAYAFQQGAGSDLDSAVRAHFAKARAAQNAGDLETAVREYQAAASLKPDFAEIHMNAGLVLHLQGKFEDSAVSLSKSLKLNPALFAARLFQGINYCKLGHPADAVPLLATAAAEKPADKQALFWFGSALLGAGNSIAAVKELANAPQVLREDIDILQLFGEAYQAAARDITEQVRTAASDPPERRLMLAQSFLAQQEWMAAEIYYTRLLKEASPPLGTHIGLATALLRLGRLEKSRLHYEQHLKADPWSAEARLGLAELAIREGKLPEALEHAGAALHIRPDHAIAAVTLFTAPPETSDAARPRYEAAIVEWSQKAGPEPEVMLGLALAFSRRGSVTQAEFQLKKMAGVLPRPISTAKAASRAEALDAARKRQYEVAVEGLRRCLRSRPDDLEAGLVLAESYLEIQRPEDAAAELRRILRQSPNRPAALLLLGRAYRDLALKTFERMVSLQPDSHRAHQLLGEFYEARKEFDNAITEYLAALRVKPNLPGLHLAIGRVHLKNVSMEEASTEFEKELAINPFDADANMDLGGIYVNREEPERAIPLLERALRVRPDSVEARRRLGQAYYKLGQYAKAEAELKQAVNADDDGSTHYLLARTYQKLDRKQEAEQAMQIVTERKAARLKQVLDRAERTRQLDQ